MVIDERLDYWKKRLLDLSKRNRLINCRLPSEGKRVQRHSLFINTPTSDNLWKLIAEDDGDLSFPIDFREDDLSEEQLQLFEQESEITNSYIKTNQNLRETNKTLRSLMKKAKDFTEEKGLNALHLAFGFLDWKENGPEGQDMRSPLLLVPVNLSQEDLFSPIVLSRSDEEITANHSLEQKLLSDFNIVLPAMTEDTDFIDYLAAVSKVTRSLGWSVSSDVTQLSLFSFMKINMYRDLERNAEKICGHSIVRAINGEALHDGTSLSAIIGYDHDSSEPKEVFSVVDADSSQQDAILLAKSGASFVLQGPPGTGKSQTITNIIAELIADGKKVLFVSEKMAALEVVYKRLTQVGLGNFCLTLHSHNAKRREILDQFDKSIKMSRTRVELQRDAYNSLYHLKETRNALNQYNTELHTVVEPLGKTIFQVNGLLAQLEDFRNIDFVQANSETFTPELLAQCESALEEVTRIVAKSGYQQHNPWNGCVINQPPTFEFRQRFLVDSSNLAAQIENGLSLLTKINEILDNSEISWSYSSISLIKEIFAISKNSPKVNPAWILLNLQLTLSNLNACVIYLREYAALEDRLSELHAVGERINSDIQNENSIQSVEDTAMNFRAVNSYNNALNTRQTLTTEKATLTTASEDTEKKLRTCEQAFHDEQKKSERAYEVWQTAQKILLERCSESILSLDAASMLVRYRSDYRSWSRVFSTAYRNDRKSMLSHCRAAEKLTFEQGLLLLDTIANVQTLKSAFEVQTNIVCHSRETLEDTRSEYENIVGKLRKTEVALATAKSKYDLEKIALKNTVTNVLYELGQQLSDKKKAFPLTDNYISLKGDLGIAISIDTDLAALCAKLEWCVIFQKIKNQYRLGSKFVNLICDCNASIFSRIDTNISELQDWETSITSDLSKFANLFDEQRKGDVYTNPLSQLLTHITNCTDNFASLEYLIDYRIAYKRLKSLGIDAYLDKAKEINLSASEIVPVFKKCFFRSWLDVVVPEYSAINEFRRLRQDERVNQFRDLDKSHLEISKAMLISKLVSRLPNFDAYSSNGEMALLRREMAKQRRLMPTRLLIAALPNLLPALKPCIMMSPLSVSTYLGNSNFEFDAVIFDEASQVRTEDAIGAIFRTKQAIIAGDSKQLPPSDFFSSSMSTSEDFEEDDDGEINDAGAYESLLDEATMLPTQTLLWHYRSRHEHLIAFSNAKIYQGNLITFPSSVEKADGMGVEYIYVSGGIYDRGGKNGNRAEAEKVAELVFEHFRECPSRSLGIIAFGEVQQSAIQDALITKRRANPTFEPFFKEDKDESLFIKNLETVQGDERDTIIFSVGYAPDASGKFVMNFGPLSRDGGERRLNVAVTRARYNLKLVGSIVPTDIDIERTNGQGPKLLRLYIDFALNGANAILGEISTDNCLIFDSPFESSVHDFLTTNGYDVVTQVGCSGYRIDMAVRHPRYNGRFAIGIECDGAMYHSARTARERDRLRQTVLEDMGWKIYRVWSTDWIKDRHTEGERLLSAVKNAIENYREANPRQTQPTAQLTDFVNVQTQTATERMNEGIKEKLQILRSYYYGWNVKEVPYNNIGDVMLKVIASNYGLDKAGLFKETATYGYGWERLGPVIKDTFDRVYSRLIHQKQIEEDSEGKINLAK